MEATLSFRGSSRWSLGTLALLAAASANLGACRGGASSEFSQPGLEQGVIDPSAPHPNWTASQNDARPISGGTLLLTRDGQMAVASDPERDQVSLVNLANHQVAATVMLNRGDEPGRIAEGGNNTLHVVLRGAGAIATIDRASGAVTARRSVCAAPRGIAYQSNGDQLHVACADGQLVTLPAAVDGTPTRRLDLGLDLRDVVLDGDRLVVSRFRSAELVHVSGDGAMSTTRAQDLTFSWPAGTRDSTGQVPTDRTWASHVAWRTAPLPGGGVVMVHQREMQGNLPLPTANLRTAASPAYYAPPPVEVRSEFCAEAVVHTTVTIERPGAPPTRGPTIASAVLPVDVAVSSDGNRFALVAAGNAAMQNVGTETWPQVQVYDLHGFDTDVQSNGDHWCARPQRTAVTNQPTGQATAAVFLPDGQLLVQTREPAALFFTSDGSTVTLSQNSRANTGHQVFHNDAGGRIACASCHPEGRDDGHVWSFDVGIRRTQNLLGLHPVTQPAPFHWAGDQTDMLTLASTVFSGRMSGGQLNPAQVDSLSHWLESLEHLPVPAAYTANTDAIARGRDLFNSTEVGCANCHQGARNARPIPSDITAVAGCDGNTCRVGTRDDGGFSIATGEPANRPATAVGAFRVPSLAGIAYRAPYMHNGCAATLRDRFTSGPCGGGDQHGHTAQLSGTQLDDLVAYVQSL